MSFLDTVLEEERRRRDAEAKQAQAAQLAAESAANAAWEAEARREGAVLPELTPVQKEYLQEISPQERPALEQRLREYNKGAAERETTLPSLELTEIEKQDIVRRADEFKANLEKVYREESGRDLDEQQRQRLAEAHARFIENQTQLARQIKADARARAERNEAHRIYIESQPKEKPLEFWHLFRDVAFAGPVIAADMAGALMHRYLPEAVAEPATRAMGAMTTWGQYAIPGLNIASIASDVMAGAESLVVGKTRQGLREMAQGAIAALGAGRGAGHALVRRVGMAGLIGEGALAEYSERVKFGQSPLEAGAKTVVNAIADIVGMEAGNLAGAALAEVLRQAPIGAPGKVMRWETRIETPREIRAKEWGKLLDVIGPALEKRGALLAPEEVAGIRRVRHIGRWEEAPPQLVRLANMRHERMLARRLEQLKPIFEESKRVEAERKIARYEDVVKRAGEREAAAMEAAVDEMRRKLNRVPLRTPEEYAALREVLYPRPGEKLEQKPETLRASGIRPGEDPEAYVRRVAAEEYAETRKRIENGLRKIAAEKKARTKYVEKTVVMLPSGEEKAFDKPGDADRYAKKLGLPETSVQRRLFTLGILPEEAQKTVPMAERAAEIVREGVERLKIEMGAAPEQRAGSRSSAALPKGSYVRVVRATTPEIIANFIRNTVPGYKHLARFAETVRDIPGRTAGFLQRWWRGAKPLTPEEQRMVQQVREAITNRASALAPYVERFEKIQEIMRKIPEEWHEHLGLLWDETRDLRKIPGEFREAVSQVIRESNRIWDELADRGIIEPETYARNRGQWSPSMFREFEKPSIKEKIAKVFFPRTVTSLSAKSQHLLKKHYYSMREAAEALGLTPIYHFGLRMSKAIAEEMVDLGRNTILQNALLKSGAAKLPEEAPEGYIRLPGEPGTPSYRRKWGSLGEYMYHPAAVDAVAEAFPTKQTAGIIMGLLRGIVKVRRMVEVPLNQAAHVRQMAGNFFEMMSNGGCSPFNPENWGHIKRSISEIAHNGPLWQEFKRGSRHYMGSWSAQFLFDASRVENPAQLAELFTQYNAKKPLAGLPSRLYSFPDQMVKFIAWSKRRAMGMTPAEADQYISYRVQDYSRPMPVIRAIEESPIGGSFLAFKAENFRTTWNQLFTLDGAIRIIGRMAIVNAVRAMGLASVGLTQREWDRYREAFNWSTSVVPVGRDAAGRVIPFNMAMLYPSLEVANPIMLMASGRLGEAADEFLEQQDEWALNNIVMLPIFEAITGRESWSGYQIWDPAENARKKLLYGMKHVLTRLLPPQLRELNVYTRMKEASARRGEPPPSQGVLFSRFAGLRVLMPRSGRELLRREKFREQSLRRQETMRNQ